MKQGVKKWYEGIGFKITLRTHDQIRKKLIGQTAVQEIANLAYLTGYWDALQDTPQKNITQITTHLKEML